MGTTTAAALPTAAWDVAPLAGAVKAPITTLLTGEFAANPAASMACVVAATGAIMAELLNGDWTGRPKVLLTCATLFTGACTSALFTDAFAALAATPAGAAATVLRKVTCLLSGTTCKLVGPNGTGSTTIGASSALVLFCPALIAIGDVSTTTPFLPDATGRTRGVGATLSFSSNIGAVSQPADPGPDGCTDELPTGTGSTIMVPFGLSASCFFAGTGSTIIAPLFISLAFFTSAAAPVDGIGSTMMFPGSALTASAE
mmetsp:Transcript_37554/g.86734  ORF Transcript_37554/g.86734 Transcript_37554/m.86734 type:complete len:258 (+) Transcript_37554:840-1613(+)